MDLIDFQSVDFAYKPEEPLVFQRLTQKFPAGEPIALMGPNGLGKSTLLLLAGGRIHPQKGEVRLFGQDTRTLEEESRNSLASMVYQNMEFETEDSLGDLLEYVLEQGFLTGTESPTGQTVGEMSSSVLREITRGLELESLLHKPTQVLSKGAMQRAVLAFALLYGSRLLILDEPVFALEEKTKIQVMEFVTDYCRVQSRELLFSIHEIDLARRFAPRIFLFRKDGGYQWGSRDELLTPASLEAAYGSPYSSLKAREELNRNTIMKALEGET